MLLGKPVVATAFSGNLEFTKEDNSLLVKHSLVSLTGDDYPYGEGQVWADPDAESAAAQMKRILANNELVIELGSQGRKTVEDAHNIRIVGAKYLKELEKKMQ
jgi:glycosyltransferase involved in cell wall biosynthesis